MIGGGWGVGEGMQVGLDMWERGGGGGHEGGGGDM